LPSIGEQVGSPELQMLNFRGSEMRKKVFAALAVSLVLSSTVSAQARDGSVIAAGFVGGLLGGLVTAGAAGAYPTYEVRYPVHRPRPLPRTAGCGLKGVSIPMGAPVQTIAIRNTDSPELNFLSAPTRVIRAEIVSRPCNATLIKTSQPLGFRYIPRAGFIGRDMYAVRGCNDRGGCSITAFVVDVDAPAVLSTATPEDALRSIAAFDRKGGGDELFNADSVTPTMARLLSAGLAADWVSAVSTRENVFDANYFTGKQSTGHSTYSEIRTVSSSDALAVVQAMLDTPNEEGRYTHRQLFTFVKEGDGWKLDEINYAPDEQVPNNLHAYIRRWIAENPASVTEAALLSNGVIKRVVDGAAARAQKVYIRSGMAGLSDEVDACTERSKKSVDKFVVLDCLAFTWASARMDNLGSIALRMPPMINARALVRPLEEKYMSLGGVQAVPMKLPQLASTAVAQALR
jgi:hypothetical protein